MTGDCHVRFCERLRGETPLCLLGAQKEGLYEVPSTMYQEECTKKKVRSTKYNVPSKGDEVLSIMYQTTEKQVPSYLPLRLGAFACAVKS